MASHFLFPTTQSSVLPDPSLFFSPELLSAPLPTNSFFQNFTLKNGDQPEYIHPYLVQLSLSSLSLSYPSRFASSSFISQTFNPDFTISAPNNQTPDAQNTHKITYFSDLSVTVDFISSNLQFFLVKGSPYLTCSVTKATSLVFSTIHAILSFTSYNSNTKYVVKLNNNQTWVIYSSSPINLTQNLSNITSDSFSGIIRVAVMPNSDPKYDPILDKFSSVYPVSGDAVLDKLYTVEYKWAKIGGGDLLMLAHPLHAKLISADNSINVVILGDFKYESIDGELEGIVGDSWSMRTEPISVSWHSTNGVEEESYAEIVSALNNDVNSLNASSIATTSSYFYGKLIARAARLALIAEEVYYTDAAISVVAQFLRQTIIPWLDGTFKGNGFLYDHNWGGIVTKQGSTDSGADFGFGVFNDHHYHLGYFLYAIAVLAKIDPVWGRNYKPQAYSLMYDFMNLDKANSNYTRLRCFDLYNLHSWASGLTEFSDGRNQESTSEAANAYYSASLLGLAYGDTQLIATGSLLTALEMHAAQQWWHVREAEGLYENVFSSANKVVGVLWANKRDSGLWFAPPEWKECRLGIQVLPILPITEALFPDVSYVTELVNWTMPALDRAGVGEGWKGFVYGLQGIYDKESALVNARNLRDFDDGNSLSNLLWWIHTRGNVQGL